MYLARCVLSSGWLPYPLGFYLMFLLACLPPGLVTLAFLSLPQSRGRGCGLYSAPLHLQDSWGKSCCTSRLFNSSQPTSLKTSPLSVRLSLKTNSNPQSRANQAAEAQQGVRIKAQHFSPSCEKLLKQYWALARLSFEYKCLILNISPHVTRCLICLWNLLRKQWGAFLDHTRAVRSEPCYIQKHSSQLTLLPLPKLRSKTHCQLECGAIKHLAPSAAWSLKTLVLGRKKALASLEITPRDRFSLFTSSFFFFLFSSLHLSVDFVGGM